MGQTIFGGSKQQSQAQSTSSSSNQAYPFLQQAYGGMANGTQGYSSLLGNLLGLGDSQAGNAAFDTYKGSTGFNSTLDAGSRAITGNAASKGLLGSGATLKALTRFGQDTNQQYFNNYLDRLLGGQTAGIQAGNAISGAGQISNSSSTSSSKGKSDNGMAAFLGQIASAAASDPRCKTDVKLIDRADNGLGVYEYRYLWDDEGVVRTGYMADEVAKIAPEALGPVFSGLMTVDYSKLPEIKYGNL